MGWNDHIDDCPSHKCNAEGLGKRFYYENGVFNANSESLTEVKRTYVGGDCWHSFSCKCPRWEILYRCNYCKLEFTQTI